MYGVDTISFQDKKIISSGDYLEKQFINNKS